jgi:2-methylcitrate dehydratase PrpD
MATGITNALVDYAQNLKYEDIPPDVLERTKHMLLDFLGVAYGGLRTGESSGPIIDGVLDLSAGAAGESAVVGRPERLPAHYAALLNATFAHSMDFDDTHRDAVIHIGTPLFATLLALADEHEVSGRDFLTAAVIGYDVTGKVGKAHGGSMHARGFHPTATTGIFGCSAAGARLLGYSAQQTANAMGLNVSQSAGSTQFLENGSWNKRFHTGLAAHNAVMSLVMARHDYLGATSPIEGSRGYFALYAGDGADASRALDGLGSDFEVMNTAVKPYPCCRYSHATIDAVADIVRAESLASPDIDGIDIALGVTGYSMVADPPEMKRVPSNVVEGQFSVYFAAAATAGKGGYAWDAYDRLDDTEVKRLMQRTNVTLQERFGSGMESIVSLRTADGRTIERTVPYPKGEPENPMTWDEMQAKFTEWSEPVIGPDRAAQVIESVASLESLSSMSELTANLGA